MTTVIDGKAYAQQLRASLAEDVAALKSEHGLIPGLAVVLVGEDPASQVYVRNKAKQTVEVGMQSFEHRLDASTDEDTLLDLIATLNDDDSVHGILVQLPLPAHINEFKVINAVSHDKDVDGFHLINVGRLNTDGGGVVPCTPLGSLMMLESQLGNLTGLNAVIVGRSNIVGKTYGCTAAESELYGHHRAFAYSQSGRTVSNGRYPGGRCGSSSHDSGRLDQARGHGH